MPTRAHQRILALVVKRMTQRGFSPIAIDGSIQGLGLPDRLQPDSFGRHRPDAVGVSEGGRTCIGEAKTADDIESARTREQLEDYLLTSGVDYAAVILGYPRSADSVVRGLLQGIGASDCPQLELLSVPDELLDAK